jgi:Histidine kinase-, DNA gyrase B-, and HSP90-like ATPase
MSTELEGFDPLAEGSIANSPDRSVFEEATRRVVQNILKSYTGYFDLFSELLQNSLDAIDKKAKSSGPGYVPRIWIDVNISDRIVRVVDNGSGMNLEELRFCFRPNVSFKNRRESRGHKGVGATFLAYGFSLIRVATKTPTFEAAVKLSGGRQWSEDYSGAYPRPKLEIDAVSVPEIERETSGTCVEILISQGQRPDLGWWNASTAGQWYQILRMRTPLGGVYLSGQSAPKVKVSITITDYANNRTTEEFDFVEYPYPHELTSVLPKVKSYDEIKQALASVEGDTSKIPQEFRRVDAFYGIWTAEEILEEESPFAGQKFLPEQEELIRRHDVSVYGCFLSSSKQWGQYQREELRIRPTPLILKGGMQIASDYMIQGDLSVIPLTSTIGYQAATHVIVHFVDGNPDMGRKVFQPELKSLAEDLARQIVNIFKRYLYLMREDTGSADVIDDTETYNWLEAKKKYRSENPLEFAHHSLHLAYSCEPSSEQDLVAVFHELVGMGVIQGVRFLCTSEQDRYDGCYVAHYTSSEVHAFSLAKRPLGVNSKLITSRESRPFVLEYKYDLDGLIADFEKEVKHPNEINAVICWKIGDDYSAKYNLRSYLVGEEGAGRQLYGATHSLWHERIKLAEIICVSDLMRFLNEPESVKAEHRTRFKA